MYKISESLKQKSALVLIEWSIIYSAIKLLLDHRCQVLCYLHVCLNVQRSDITLSCQVVYLQYQCVPQRVLSRVTWQSFPRTTNSRFLSLNKRRNHGENPRMSTRENIAPNPPRWKPNSDPASIHVPGLNTSAPVHDQIEQIEQLITIKLQVSRTLCNLQIGLDLTRTTTRILTKTSRRFTTY